MSNLISIVTSFVIGSTIILFLKITFETDFILAGQVDKLRLTIIIRTDLGMDRGKSATQCAHAAISCYKKALKRNPKVIENWENEGQSKVVLKPNAAGEDVLLKLAKTAESNRLVTCIIRDNKQTGMEQGIITAVGIGPGNAVKIHKITGHLKLL